jgi:hypothetical protein
LVTQAQRQWSAKPIYESMRKAEPGDRVFSFIDTLFSVSELLDLIAALRRPAVAGHIRRRCQGERNDRGGEDMQPNFHAITILPCLVLSP